MKNATLIFLVKQKEECVTEVCLAMKKRGFGAGRWNGAGGKVKDGETIEEALIRETVEEIGVVPVKYSKVALLCFRFPYNESWDQIVHAYLCAEWTGEPRESEEMAPRWFSTNDIPFDTMWPDDIHWLPLVLNGKKIKKAQFVFDERDAILEKSVEAVDFA